MKLYVQAIKNIFLQNLKLPKIRLIGRNFRTKLCFDGTFRTIPNFILRVFGHALFWWFKIL